MIATTIEQGKELLSLGIDKDTADMAWTYYDKQYNLSVYGVQDELNPEHPDMPAWSLEGLLKVMSFPMVYQSEGKSPEHFRKWKCNQLLNKNHFKKWKWECNQLVIESGFFDTPIEAAIDCIKEVNNKLNT